MSAFIIKLLTGQRPVVYGTGDKKRDFVFVDDVNDFHLQCLNDARTDGQTYNLGSGTNHSILDIYKRIERLLDTGIAPEFRPNLPGEAETTLADISKAGAIGWQPRTSLDEGLRRSIAYIRAHVTGHGASASLPQPTER